MYLKKPKFWDKPKFTFFSIILYPFTLIVELINFFKKRNNIKSKIKTICIGNIYLGGTGKTPLVVKIHETFKNKSKIAIVKKKYQNQKDEQNLLSKHGRLFCSKNRTNALHEAEEEGYELAILDDGLQDKNLSYDLSIVCFNNDVGIGNGLLIPAGPLRENLNNLNNYQAVFLIGDKENLKLNEVIKKKNNSIKIFQGKYVALNEKNFNKSKKYISFCGIGNPLSFDKILEKYNFKVVKKIHFPDHFNFSYKDLKKIKEQADKEDLTIITTEKDFLRLNENDKKQINFLKIDLEIEKESEFFNFINKFI